MRYLLKIIIGTIQYASVFTIISCLIDLLMTNVMPESNELGHYFLISMLPYIICYSLLVGIFSNALSWHFIKDLSFANHIILSTCSSATLWFLGFLSIPAGIADFISKQIRGNESVVYAITFVIFGTATTSICYIAISSKLRHDEPEAP
jgi:hypothetical protein